MKNSTKTVKSPSSVSKKRKASIYCENFKNWESLLIPVPQKNFKEETSVFKRGLFVWKNSIFYDYPVTDLTYTKLAEDIFPLLGCYAFQPNIWLKEITFLETNEKDALDFKKFTRLGKLLPHHLRLYFYNTKKKKNKDEEKLHLFSLTAITASQTIGLLKPDSTAMEDFFKKTFDKDFSKTALLRIILVFDENTKDSNVFNIEKLAQLFPVSLLLSEIPKEVALDKILKNANHWSRFFEKKIDKETSFKLGN